MVGLHVVDDDVVDVADGDAQLVELSQQGFGHSVPAAHTVDDGDLLSLDDVGVEAHPVGDGPHPLEQDVAHVGAEPENIGGHFGHVHGGTLA